VPPVPPPPLASLPLPALLLEPGPELPLRLANPAFERAFSLSPARIPRLSDWLALTYPSEEYCRRVLDQWQEAAAAALEGGSASLQCRVVAGDGEQLEVQFQLAPHGGLLLVLLVDVTARMRTEAALEEARLVQAEAALAITEAIPVGTYTMVMPPDRPVAYFAFMSERFLQLTGLDRARARENPLEGFAAVHPDDYDAWLQLNAEAFAARRPFYGETRVVIQGETRWITAESTPRALPDGSTVWEGVLIDVTERVLAQKRLEQSEANLQRILDNLPIPVATLRITGEGEARFLNRRFQDTFHYSVDQLSDVATWFGLAYPDPVYRAEVERRWSEALAEADGSGGRLPMGEYRVRCGDGADRDVLISGTRLDDLLVVTLVDITERRRSERELVAARERERRLEEQQRLRLEQKLRTSLAAAAVAHEINQPLSSMLLNCRLMQARLEQGGQAALEAREGLAAFVADLAAEADRVVTISAKMRSLLRSVQTSREPVDLAAVVEGSLLYLRPQLLAAAVACRVEGLEQPCWIAGDPDQLQVAVSNLLRNAIEALAHTEAARQILLTLRPAALAGEPVELEIADSGPGIPAGVIEALPLCSTKPDGSGIGLYVVQTTVENHGGSLAVGRSSLGGAAICLRFPAASPPQQA
jgi:signal transduction histidine kinase